MHEVSIALGMADELDKIARDNHANKITSVRLKIGRLSGIVTDSLIFAFDAVKLEHPVLSSAEIFINEVPAVYKCKDCGTVFETEDPRFSSCRQCNSYKLVLISGEEQHIESVEAEVPEDINV